MIEMPHHYSATALAMGFLKSDADSILFVDDDMVFSQNSLNRLRYNEAGMAYDAVGGLCLSRSAPHLPVIWQHHDNGQFKVVTLPVVNMHYDVAFLGLAFTLIRRKVIEDAVANKAKNCMLFSWQPDGCSEDAAFFLASGKRGHVFAVDTGVHIGHRIPVVVNYEPDKGCAYQEADPIKVGT